MNPVYAEEPVLRVNAHRLETADGRTMVLKGVNKMFIWRDLEGATIPEIEKTGANAIRIVWLRDGDLAVLEALIARVAATGMVAIPELHDGTIAGREDAGWGMLEELVDWWVSPPVVEILNRYESHLIINIANELGKAVEVAAFREGYAQAIKRIRGAGFRCPIMIDCNEYGQNIAMIRQAGPDLLQADPLQNVIFSVHTWWHLPWGWSQDRAERELRETIDTGLPFIIGEFSGAGIQGREIVDYDPLLRMAVANDIGYLVWSWGPGNTDNPDMDMTEDGTADTLHGYGRDIVEHPAYGFAGALRLPGLPPVVQP